MSGRGLRASRSERSRGGHRIRWSAVAVAAAVVLGTLGVLAPPASAALSSVGPTDPASLFPSYYADANGLQLQLCQDGLPYCLSGPQPIQDVHAAQGGTAGEAFYFDATATVAGFKMETGLEAAYLGAGSGQEMTFMRTQATNKTVTPNGTYHLTDPYGSYTCTASSSGLVQPSKGCRTDQGPVPEVFTAALTGRIGPFLTWDTFGTTGPDAPPAGYIGDNTTPHAVIGSPTGFNKMRVSGPGITGTCTNSDGTTVANCQETDKLILQGKVQPGGASAALSSGTLDFGDVPASPAVTKTLTYVNTGSAPITIGSMEVTGAGASAFGLTDNCPVAPTALDVGARCTVDVAFTPDPGRSSAATLTIADDTPTGTHDVALQGSDLPDLVASDPAPPAALAFGSQLVGSASPESNVVIGNTGKGPLTVTSATLAGPSQGHFGLGGHNTCSGTTVPPGGGCEIGVIFAPATAGSKTASLHVTDANGVALDVPLTGTGTTTATDTTPPTPATLTVTRAGTTANLSWTAATDNVAVTGYQVFRDGSQVGANLAAGARSFADSALAPGTYGYTVKAMDTAGNVTASNAVSVTVPVLDTAPPSTPALTGSVTGTTANLTWTAATDNVAVTGYRVFRNANQVGGDLAASARSFSDTVLAAGTYSYTVKAVDAAGNVGNASTPVSLTVATATGGPTVSARTPAVSATAVPIANNVTATFSKAVTGVSGSTFTLKNAATGAAVGAVVSRNGTTNQWILNPNASLAKDTRYTVTLSGGTTGIRDAANNPLANATWTFLTGPRPTISARTPTAAATGVSRTANVTATFSEAVAGVSGSTFQLKNPAGTVITAVVSHNGTTNQWILNPSPTLAANTKFTVTLTGGAANIHDTAGNALTTASWSFTTGP
jgi:Bacterial Ig-like domain/Abnormal spindle-like microcephaly-assoc'd, ASPM-SPD-2-Hydin